VNMQKDVCAACSIRVYLIESSMEVFAKIKKIFDPAGIMNPGVKLDVKLDEIKSMVRSEYSLDHQYNHLPRG
jgi:hypothetical protein